MGIKKHIPRQFQDLIKPKASQDATAIIMSYTGDKI